MSSREEPADEKIKSVRERLLTLICEIRGDEHLMEDPEARSQLRQLETFYDEDLADYAKLAEEPNKLFQPIIHPMLEIDDPGLSIDQLKEERRRRREAHYARWIDPGAREISTKELAQYLGVDESALRTRLSERGIVSSRNLELPFQVSGMEAVILTALGGKGRGKGNRYRRIRHPAFDCLAWVVNFVPGDKDPVMCSRYQSESLKSLLERCRDDENLTPDGLKELMSTLAFRFGVYARHDLGLVIAKEGEGVNDLFAGTPWADGQHSRWIGLLPWHNETKWDVLRLPLDGECFVLPWHKLIFNLDAPRMKSR